MGRGLRRASRSGDEIRLHVQGVVRRSFGRVVDRQDGRSGFRRVEHDLLCAMAAVCAHRLLRRRSRRGGVLGVSRGGMRVSVEQPGESRLRRASCSTAIAFRSIGGAACGSSSTTACARQRARRAPTRRPQARALPPDRPASPATLLRTCNGRFPCTTASRFPKPYACVILTLEL